MEKITLKTTKQVKKDGTKTVWINDSVKTEKVTKEHHDNATSQDTRRFFKSLGGSESVTREYTCSGYLVTQVVSTSPDKQKRTIRNYKFE